MNRWIVSVALLFALGLQPATPTDPPEAPMRILHLPIRPWYPDENSRNIDALRTDGVSWFSHVWISVPAWQEFPDALDDVWVQHALRICRTRGLEVLWGRWLWITWPERVTGTSVPTEAEYKPAYYAAALARVKEEAARIGAAGTFLEAEPYGDSPQKWLKTTDLTAFQQHRIRRAVKQAIEVIGPVDFLFPASHKGPGRYSWALGDLGRYKAHGSLTWRSKPPNWSIIQPNPPPQSRFTLHLWGSWIGSAPDLPTPAELRQWDLSLIRTQHPECIGLFVYFDRDRYAQILGDW